MLNYGWIKNQDNVVYVDVNEFADNFGKEVGINNLKEKLEDFLKKPIADGAIVKGTKRTALKLFIPDLLFADKDKIDLGDTVWIYIGDLYPCYCVYWPR